MRLNTPICEGQILFPKKNEQIVHILVFMLKDHLFWIVINVLSFKWKLLSLDGLWERHQFRKALPCLEAFLNFTNSFGDGWNMGWLGSDRLLWVIMDHIYQQRKVAQYSIHNKHTSGEPAQWWYSRWCKDGIEVFDKNSLFFNSCDYLR